VKLVGSSAPPIALALLAWKEQHNLNEAFCYARRALGKSITSDQYARSYDTVLQLHLLRELQMVHDTDISIQSTRDPLNHRAIIENTARSLTKCLDERFSTTSPQFRIREAMLAIRRTAFGLVGTTILKPQIGHAWIQSSKIARKAGYEQTAYSATLQAKEADAPLAFLQQVKLSRAHGGAFKALTDLENAVVPLLQNQVIDMTDDRFLKDRNLAKVSRSLDQAYPRPSSSKPDGQMRLIDLSETRSLRGTVKPYSWLRSKCLSRLYS